MDSTTGLFWHLVGLQILSPCLATAQSGTPTIKPFILLGRRTIIALPPMCDTRIPQTPGPRFQPLYQMAPFTVMTTMLSTLPLVIFFTDHSTTPLFINSAHLAGHGHNSPYQSPIFKLPEGSNFFQKWTVWCMSILPLESGPVTSALGHGPKEVMPFQWGLTIPLLNTIPYIRL